MSNLSLTLEKYPLIEGQKGVITHNPLF